MTAKQVLSALAAIRAPQAQDEYDLHGLAADALQRADIAFRHEAPLAKRCRIDFLCGRVGIEIKRGRPDRAPVEKQLLRYAETGMLDAIILLSEKTLPALPGFIARVPVYPVSLYKLWGIATDAAGDVPAQKQDAAPVPAEDKPETPEENPLPAPMTAPMQLEDRILSDLLNEDTPPFLRQAGPAPYYYGTLS